MHKDHKTYEKNVTITQSDHDVRSIGDLVDALQSIPDGGIQIKNVRLHHHTIVDNMIQDQIYDIVVMTRKNANRLYRECQMDLLIPK